MTQDRYTRMGWLLAAIQRLKEARETAWLACVTCQYHDLRTQPGGLPYGQKIHDRLDSVDHLIAIMVADVERQCEYAREEREGEGEEGITLPPDPGPDTAA